jgi:hypothetical protein
MVYTDNENLDETRTIPEVLFVDEDGNPIEGGKENFIYVDEAGNEIDDQIANQLIDSGNYLPSTYLNGVKKSGSRVNQASLPASSFGSFSKSTAGSQMAGEFQRKSSSNVLAQLHNSESAQNSAANLNQSQSQDSSDLKKSQSARRIAQQPPAKQNSNINLIQNNKNPDQQDRISYRSALSPDEIPAAENAAKNQEDNDSRTQSRFSTK